MTVPIDPLSTFVGGILVIFFGVFFYIGSRAKIKKEEKKNATKPSN